jgi:predicted DNA-binding transcriptional regulator YafY
LNDKAVGRVADVERLLGVLALLRNNGGGWVSHPKLRSSVPAYRDSTADEDSVARMMQRDMEALRNLGFAIDGETHEGTTARYRLQLTAWRVPLDLDRDEQRLLAWVMAAAGATNDPSPPRSSLPSLVAAGSGGPRLGAVPRALDAVHTALAERRQLVILHREAERTIEPVQLTVQNSRWFLIARYAGANRFYGFRLDRMTVLNVGDPVEREVTVPDPLTVIDNTAWQNHEPVDVELRCGAGDREWVAGWFPRAEVSVDGDEVALRMPVSNLEALLDRVLRFGGAVRVAAPERAVVLVRERAAMFAGAAS